MYILLLVLGFAVAFAIGSRGGRRNLRSAVCIALATVAFFACLGLFVDALWFDSLGYRDRFWRLISVHAIAIVVGALAASAGVRAFAGKPATRPMRSGRAPELIAAALGGVWGFATWKELLLFLARVPTSIDEPILGYSTGFYLFVLPLLGKLLWLGVIILGMAAVSNLPVTVANGRPIVVPLGSIAKAATRLSGGIALFFAGCAAVSICHLLYSPMGVVHGPGWTDVHVRLPALRLVVLMLIGLAAISWTPALRRRLPLLFPRRLGELQDPLGRLTGAWFMAAAAGFMLVGVAPGVLQWLVVKPNEISFERPYLEHSIEFTRHGFRLHEAEVRQFPASENLDSAKVARNRDLLDEARLWDQGALDAVYKQFQEIRLYYEFFDVDMDRYSIGNRYRQVMVSARELAHQNLPEQSQTFVNERFKYTHGYGVTIAPVHDFTPDGLPDLLVKDVPPRSSVPDLVIERPEIYYGELTRQPVVVRSLEPEFDFPRGDQNVYTRYEGSGGIPLQSLFRKFAIGWRVDGTLFLFSSYPRADARVMLHREIRKRAQVLAPFLRIDADPYIVVSEGRLFWILDAYTTSDYYPYAEPLGATEEIEYRDGERSFRLASRDAALLRGVNYARNSVKIVIDAYEGDVDFYVFDDEDPLLRAWRRAFPGLFKPKAAMPADLRAHVRYPEAFLLAQGLMYRKYHMTDAEVFYNQEDLWIRATEKYHAELQALRPYYVMWKPPGAERPEFGLILPFTPKNRQVMIGWIAGLCDGDNYGRFIAYQFPKEKRVLGPQQVETKIDQDRHLAAQLTLWDQHGSKVIRGNTLAIPIEDALLYLEPIYLQAETAAYPELRLVVAMHGDNLSYGETFEEAMAKLLEDEPIVVPASRDFPLHEPTAARRARDAFDRYLRHQGAGEFRAAAQALEDLSAALNGWLGEGLGEGAGEGDEAR